VDRDEPRLMRRLWLAFTAGVVALAAVLTVVADVEPTLPVVLPLALAAVIGFGGLVAVLAIDRVFAASPPADDDTALGELRTRLVLQAVIAETVVLATTVVAFLFGPRWTVAIGGLAGALILVRVRPHRTRFERFDRAWRQAGHDVSLCRGLRSPAHPDDPDRPPAPNGPVGPKDRPGTDGPDGRPGTDGPDGRPGTDGPDGRPGTDGPDGRPGTDNPEA
jgi:F0F1-type ATP synthase membrane subunit c/vacuolar-type H+-ATPase subunit K